MVKSHPRLEDIKVVSLEATRNLQDVKQPQHCLVFCDLDKGKIDPYRSVLASPAVLPYLKGLLALDGKDRAAVMRYCFAYLEHPDDAIARDAFIEFMASPDADIMRAGAHLSRTRLQAWLQSPSTSPDRLRLYGFLLGCCGKDRDADVLRALLDRLFGKKDCPTLDGVLTGYVLLRPMEGRVYARRLLKDAGKPFAARYSALRMARFFHTTRPDLLSEDEILDLLRPMLLQDDFNDLTVETLRKWRIWKMSDEVLAVEHKSAHLAPIARRALIRYALECPGPRAAAFVAAARHQDEETVQDIAENLALEREQEQPASGKGGS
jgi:hypothetical protein